jgi:hypothetical protein
MVEMMAQQRVLLTVGLKDTMSVALTENETVKRLVAATAPN